MDNILKKSFSTYEEKVEEIKSKRNPHMDKKYAVLSEMKELWVVFELLLKVLTGARALAKKVFADVFRCFSSMSQEDDSRDLGDIFDYLETITYRLEEFYGELAPNLSNCLSSAAFLFSKFELDREVAV